jgi:hypothetical protein
MAKQPKAPPPIVGPAPTVAGYSIPPPRPQGGRPPKLHPDDATLQLIRNLGSIRATTKEVAAVLGVTEKTFIDFKSKHDSVEEAYLSGHELGKVSQRRDMLALAKKNGMVAIFMAMNQLGMKDLRQQWAWQGQGEGANGKGNGAGDRRVVVIKGGLPEDEPTGAVPSPAALPAAIPPADPAPAEPKADGDPQGSASPPPGRPLEEEPL